MVSNILDWQTIVDSYASSNAISLIVSLINGKCINFFYFNVICFFRIIFWIGKHDLVHTKIDKFTFVFKESCCLWIFSTWIWNVSWMRFSLKNYCLNLKKMERWPSTKVYCAYFRREKKYIFRVLTHNFRELTRNFRE